MAKPISPLLLLAVWFLAAGTTAKNPIDEGPTPPGMLPAFVSLSVESSNFHDWAGTKVFKNDLTKHLVKHLSDAQFAPIAIRVGGKSADLTTFNKHRHTSEVRPCGEDHTDATSLCVGRRFFQGYGAMRRRHTVLSHNFNLATYNSSGRWTLNNTGSIVMCRYLHDETQVVELGNEPDLYSTEHRRLPTYSIANYVEEWRKTRHQLDDFVKEACPEVSAKSFVKYMYPSISSMNSQWDVAEMLKALNKEDAHRIDQVSVHHTMGRALQTSVTLEGLLMNHTAVKESVQQHVEYSKHILANFSAPYVLGQIDVLTGGGAEGMTDTFGAALWAMDFSLAAAASGAIKRLYFHQDFDAASAAWRAVRPICTKAMFYGLFAAGTFLANSSRLAVTEFDVEPTGPSSTVAGYRAYQDGVLARVAILNLKPYDIGAWTHEKKMQPRSRRRFFIDVGVAESRWQLLRLAAPGAHYKDMISFNGRHYSSDVIGMKDGAGAEVPGRNYDEAVWANDRGIVEVLVKDTEAVIMIQPEDV
ncbi:hypothetical protein E4U42_006262 [Claviceps africana]|uniref:Beta-glucuronidase C-terminal domain-containing protein n=1 Tax=Claviceps africana TaxID=83212 RepID=A0A8K0J5F1_9HYPO|nr:hypothetical protein E4U42_006262 [Claviceps africana]